MQERRTGRAVEPAGTHRAPRPRRPARSRRSRRRGRLPGSAGGAGTHRTDRASGSRAGPSGRDRRHDDSRPVRGQRPCPARSRSTVSSPTSALIIIDVVCPDGTVITGGGYRGLALCSIPQTTVLHDAGVTRRSRPSPRGQHVGRRGARSRGLVILTGYVICAPTALSGAELPQLARCLWSGRPGRPDARLRLRGLIRPHHEQQPVPLRRGGLTVGSSSRSSDPPAPQQPPAPKGRGLACIFARCSRELDAATAPPAAGRRQYRCPSHGRASS